MYMHDARYTRSRLVSWIHMYNGDEQEVRKGERIEVQKRRPHSASKSESSRVEGDPDPESAAEPSVSTPTKCTYVPYQPQPW